MNWDNGLYLLGGLIMGAFFCVCFYDIYIIPQ
ncbi:unnamed protein product, partial [marine sediment metagenome]